MEFIEEKVREPFEFTRKLPGKSLRSKLIDVFNKWIGADDESKNLITLVIEMLHNASLMIDDIEDSSSLRRGEVCAYKRFGVPLTLNSANLAYFEALKLLQTLNNSVELSMIFTEEMINLHVGQGTEIYFRDLGDRIPTLEEYFKICSMKTGGLFRLFARLLLKCTQRPFESKTKDLIVDLAEKLGKFYQIRDDYLNLFAGDASDLIEGKYTLPTIFADIKEIKCENEAQIKEILRKLDEIEADKFCLRTLTELVVEMDNIIFEIEQLARSKSNLKEIIYSLLDK